MSAIDINAMKRAVCAMVVMALAAAFGAGLLTGLMIRVIMP